ncbi:MAG: AAA family ATPase [Clostridia bacterium]|nr:AAA family ATPase [Clostridia bacterium]
MVLAKAAKDAERRAQGEEPQTDLLTAQDVPADPAANSSLKSGYDELNELIGMEQIADRVREIVAQVKLALKNDRLEKPCIHMRFLGHPGTGKTTVARIIGRIFREEGILRKGAFLEYSARQLCAEYVGQTAVRTASICRDAYGSVLFIDEAYALYQSDYQYNDYGKEALTTLISEMENHRDDMLVIMAGYTDDMETLMRGNAGLRSRVPYAISFPNYTKTQLYEIFMLMVRKHFDYTDEFEQVAKDYFESLSDEYIASKEFANARFVRNLYERTWSKGALRAALNGSERFALTKKDLLAASAEKEFSEKLTKEKAKIGF